MEPKSSSCLTTMMFRALTPLKASVRSTLSRATQSLRMWELKIITVDLSTRLLLERSHQTELLCECLFLLPWFEWKCGVYGLDLMGLFLSVLKVLQV